MDGTLRWQPMARRLGMAEEFLPGFTMPQLGWLLLGIGIGVAAYLLVPEALGALRPVFVLYPTPLALLLPRRIKGRRTAWVNLVSLFAYCRTYRRAVYGGRAHAEHR